MIEYHYDKIVLSGSHAFSPEQTFECGQCFRFDRDGDAYSGIAGGRFITVRGDEECTRLYCAESDFELFWRGYFDLDRDYSEALAAVCGDEFLRTAAEFGSGIRILNQEPWEALCSFIISQCNNIPRIKGIIKKLCSLYGEKKPWGYCFPKPEAIAWLEVEDLAQLRAGYRAPYIIAAAKAVVSGTLELSSMKESNESTDKLRARLLELPGVGPKVADCALLYGLARRDAFPIDVWMKRALRSVYPEGYDSSLLGEKAGIVQQYIFYYARKRGLDLFEKNKDV